MSSPSDVNGYNLRSRTPRSNASPVDQDDFEDRDSWLDDDHRVKYDKAHGPHQKADHFLGVGHWLFLIVYIGVLHLTSLNLDQSMPPVQEATKLDVFSEQRARAWLERLVEMGPRPSGSYANEVHARNVIHDQLKSIRSQMKSVHRLDVSTQRPDGCFNLGFLSPTTLCYQNLTNIVVRFGPNSGSESWNEHAVLVNSHFDTLPDSPGASDAGVSCAIMLDVLRVLANRDTPLKHDIIFLFNGGEENFMQASHGFITQHPWRHNIRALINLEGAGAGGREILFQAGPGNPWLVKTYMENAPHPHCAVIAQEVFQSGLFPSDTDFRIFRDFGRIPGLDIAYVRNGFVYHSEFDRPEFINKGSIQRSGENVLAVLTALVNSPYLSHPAEYHEGQWVFFDVLGVTTFWYSERIGQFINWLCFLGVMLKIALNVFSKNQVGRRRGLPVRRETSYSLGLLLQCLLVHLLSLVVFALFGLVLTQLVGLLKFTMVWYSRPWLIIPVYILPMTILGALLHLAFVNRYRSSSVPGGFTRDPYILERAHFDSAQLISALVMLVLICCNLASAYFVMINVFSGLCRSPLTKLITYLRSRATPTSLDMLVAHVVSLLPMCIMSSYGVILLVEIFFPTMGRVGGIFNPEFFAYVVSLLSAFVMLMFLSPLLHVSHNVSTVLKLLGAFTVFCWALMFFTYLGHPYLYDPVHPKCRRTITLHTTRHIHGVDGSVNTDHSIWHQALDYRGADDLPVEGMTEKSVHADCSQTPDGYCDMPFYGPTVQLFPIENSLKTPIEEPADLPHPIDIKLIDKSVTAAGTVNMTFQITGSDRQSYHVTPINGFRITSWSFTDHIVASRSNYTNFMFLASAHSPTTWKFWMRAAAKSKVSNEKLLADKQLHMSVGQHYCHGEHQNSQALKELIQRVITRREDQSQWRWAITLITGNAELVANWY